MKNFEIMKNGHYKIDDEIFTEEELVESVGATVAGLVKTTVETMREKIKNIARGMFRRAKERHMREQINEHLENNPEVSCGFKVFDETIDDYIERAKKKLARKAGCIGHLI